MPDDATFSKYLRAAAATIVVGAVIVVVFVVVVDPYRLYRLVDIPGVNHAKPRPNRFQDEIKLSNAMAAGTDAVILGNSRAESGLDPDSLAWRERHLEVYNLAIAGTGIVSAKRQLDYLIAHGRTPRVVVLGVEFLDFLVDSAASDDTPTPNVGHPIGAWRWRFATLFSIASIGDALTTLRMQRDPGAETLTARGFNPLAQYAQLAQREGQYALFRQRAEENAKVFVQKPTGLGYRASGRSEDLDTFRAILDATARHRIELQVVIYPYHAQLLAMLENAGLGPAFAQWKARLLEEIDAARANFTGVNVVLWDFSGYDGPHCDPIPHSGDRATVTQWYWESGHFKKALGDLVLAEILKASGQRKDENRFGVTLTRESLLANETRLTMERKACERRDPSIFSEATQLIDGARAKHQQFIGRPDGAMR